MDFVQSRVIGSRDKGDPFVAWDGMTLRDVPVVDPGR